MNKEIKINLIIDINNKQLIFNDKNVFIILDEENNLWFKAKDVADLLEFTNTRKAIRVHVREKHKILYEGIGRKNSFPPYICNLV